MEEGCRGGVTYPKMVTVDSQTRRKNYTARFIRGQTPAAAAWRSPAAAEAMLNLGCNYQALQARVLIQQASWGDISLFLLVRTPRLEYQCGAVELDEDEYE
ncbi:unnamed protein product [Sphagnum jensenii]